MSRGEKKNKPNPEQKTPVILKTKAAHDLSQPTNFSISLF